MSYPDPLYEDDMEDQAPEDYDFQRVYDPSGGQAFPSYEVHPHGTYPVHGMSLRDYFAGAALAGLVQEDPYLDQVKLAKRAFQIADAMVFMAGERGF